MEKSTRETQWCFAFHAWIFSLRLYYNLVYFILTKFFKYFFKCSYLIMILFCSAVTFYFVEQFFFFFASLITFVSLLWDGFGQIAKGLLIFRNTFTTTKKKFANQCCLLSAPGIVLSVFFSIFDIFQDFLKRFYRPPGIFYLINSTLSDIFRF